MTDRWSPFSPRFLSGSVEKQYFAHVDRLLSTVKEEVEPKLEVLKAIRQHLVSRDAKTTMPAAVRAACLVLLDLVEQGWTLRGNHEHLEICKPETSPDAASERDRVRRQLHAERDRQLDVGSVREFIAEMEAKRLYRGRWTSVFSLMRNGEELARALRRALTSEHSTTVVPDTIRPYVEPAIEGGNCKWTGLPLVGIWRYFRHTWANPYRSVPGRSLMFLVRDAAAEDHPVIGIFELASSAVQISVRDRWIGWSPDEVIERLRRGATDEDVNWLLGLIQKGLEELYLVDLLDPSVSPLTLKDLSCPGPKIIGWLNELSRLEREQHNRLANVSSHKRNVQKEHPAGEERWKLEAETHLFRSKRAETLAMFLRARSVLSSGSGCHSAAELRTALGSPEKRQAIQSLIRRAKSERVGIAMADIAVCGSVPPYSCLLGGKLVAMLAASPGVVRAYSERYSNRPSVIASSLAARSVIRASHLVFLGTTSLYGTEPTQYTRVNYPCDRVGGHPVENISYKLLGRTEGFGTLQFSDDAMDALSQLKCQTEGGQRVHSIFGEGVSPRLRKIRDALDYLGLSSDLLLSHGSPRLVYGIALARNFRKYLLGLDDAPEYLFPINNHSDGAEAIAAWWAERWLANRLRRPSVLEEVARHTLKYPVRHGARVVIPKCTERELPYDGEPLLVL